MGPLSAQAASPCLPWPWLRTLKRFMDPVDAEANEPARQRFCFTLP